MCSVGGGRVSFLDKKAVLAGVRRTMENCSEYKRKVDYGTE